MLVMEIDAWELKAAIICIIILAAICIRVDGHINITTSKDRLKFEEDCNHWGLYYESSLGCAHCMFQTKDMITSRKQPGCNGTKLGDSVYAEVSPHWEYDAVSRCDVNPLLKPGVLATCTYNTILYPKLPIPTAHPGALCYFTCADGYTPALDYITYIECSSCTTKGQWCQWNTTLSDTLCHPGSHKVTAAGTQLLPALVPTAASAPLLLPEHKTTIIAVSTSVLLIVMFIVAVYYKHCRKCAKNIRKPKMAPEVEIVEVPSEREEDTCNASQPLFIGDQVEGHQTRVNVERLKSLDSDSSQESGYSSNADRQLTLAKQQVAAVPASRPSINNINNYYQQVHMCVNGDVNTVTIGSSVEHSSKPSSIDLCLADNSEVSIEQREFCESLQTVGPLGESADRNDSAVASINSTPVCDHRLTDTDTATLSDDAIKAPDSGGSAFTCADEVLDITQSPDISSSMYSDEPPITILPKQKNPTDGIIGRCITKDSGIATVDSDELASIADELSVCPTPRLHQLTEQDDVVQLPADNLNSLPSSTSSDSEACNRLMNIPEELFDEQQSPVKSLPLASAHSNCDFNNSTNQQQLVDYNKNLLALISCDVNKISSLELEMPSIDSVSLRQHPDGNSDDLPALDACPRSLTFEGTMPEDSLLFSDFNTAASDSEQSDFRAQPQHRMNKVVCDVDESLAELKLDGPQARSASVSCPRPLTENPPGDPSSSQAPHYQTPPSPLYQMPPFLYPTRYPVHPNGYVYAALDHRLGEVHALPYLPTTSPPPYDDARTQYLNYLPVPLGGLALQQHYPLPLQQAPMMQALPTQARQPDRTDFQHPPEPRLQPDREQPTYGARQPHPIRPCQSTNQNPPHQTHNAHAPGDLVIKAKRVDELVVEKQRIVNGSADDVCSIIKETSLYPQQGAVHVESDSIGSVISRNKDDIVTPERRLEACSS